MMTTICPTGRPDWRVALRRYLLFLAAANLLWEFAHLPLYTIWLTAKPPELVFAVLHCTGGDVLIALSAIVLALLLFGNSEWPRLGPGRVLLAVLAFGIGYTIFSEWLNIVVRQAWAYRDLMPVIPVIDTGLSPFMQWLVVPLAAYSYATGWRPWRRKKRESVHA